MTDVKQIYRKQIQVNIIIKYITSLIFTEKEKTLSTPNQQKKTRWQNEIQEGTLIQK